jgi:hypothetical protein
VWQDTFFTTVVNAACFMFHALVDLPSFLLDLASSIVIFALEKLGEISSMVSQMIQYAANKIVNGFNAFMQWAIKYIKETVETMVSPLISTAKNAMDAFYTKIKSRGRAHQTRHSEPW